MPEQSHAIDHNGGHTLLPAYFGEFGGQYVPELLIPALDQLERAFVEAMDDPSFREELAGYLRDYLGRPTPLTECSNLPLPGKGKGYARIFLKREDLVQPGTRAGAASKTHGQDAHHCGNRCRSARNRNRPRLRTVGLGLRDLHGHRGRR